MRAALLVLTLAGGPSRAPAWPSPASKARAALALAAAAAHCAPHAAQLGHAENLDGRPAAGGWRWDDVRGVWWRPLPGPAVHFQPRPAVGSFPFHFQAAPSWSCGPGG